MRLAGDHLPVGRSTGVDPSQDLDRDPPRVQHVASAVDVADRTVSDARVQDEAVVEYDGVGAGHRSRGVDGGRTRPPVRAAQR
jgi:hypothetical protein